uniref:Uncharacterized protein n=1 Tax=Zea mays TaxID=4577 RepID=C0P5P7_MAIZE|nr:unknown [Zea mays]
MPAPRRQRHPRWLPLRRLHRRGLPRNGESVPVPQGGLLYRSQLQCRTCRDSHLRDWRHLPTEHTDTSHGFGIGTSSNWICLAFLLAISRMAQPEKRQLDAFHPSFIWR